MPLSPNGTQALQRLQDASLALSIINGRGSLGNEASAVYRAYTSNLVKNHTQPPPSSPGCPRYPLTAGWTGGWVSLPQHRN